MNLEGRRITGGTIEVETIGSYRNTVNIYPGGTVNLAGTRIQFINIEFADVEDKLLDTQERLTKAYRQLATSEHDLAQLMRVHRLQDEKIMKMESEIQELRKKRGIRKWTLKP